MAVEAVRVEGVSKVFPPDIQALTDVSLTVEQGEFLVVIGLSGSGKSTLLRCINRLHDPTEGRIWLFGEEITGAEGAHLRRLRSSERSATASPSGRPPRTDAASPTSTGKATRPTSTTSSTPPAASSA